jgi:CHAT domain-containing protein
LETELSIRNSQFFQEMLPSTLSTVQAALPHDSVIIEWVRYVPFNPDAKDENAQWGNPQYVAYVLPHDGEPVVVDVGDAAALETQVRDFQSALSDPNTAFMKEVAYQLFEKLMKPLLPYLGTHERLLISPDGVLNLIPFAALLDETGAYLTTRREIVYLTSGRDVLRLGAPPTSRGGDVVVADPDYGSGVSNVSQAGISNQVSRSLEVDSAGLVFKRLRGTATEARALKSLLKVKDQNLLIQANATEARLRRLHGPRILHIGTHGFFLRDQEVSAAKLKAVGSFQDERPFLVGENPLLRSGLALAGANSRRSGKHDDGILTAAEVAQMDLHGTQLVVLSACETGVGEVQNGEGVYGLRRALMLAGAQTQVTSLWKVPDAATKDLMVEYYQRLIRGDGRSAALREAQRKMIKSKTRAHPYYWAAFVLIGQWSPLTLNW